ncbi:MAG: hypothetical protein OEX22_04950 [Cyclobacteriaceae bacterium]|nr:hypothetical protein [Cyclobacteriaceae bacterium]
MSNSPEIQKKIKSSTNVKKQKQTLLPNNEDLSENSIKKFISESHIRNAQKTQWEVSIDEFDGPNSMVISLENRGYWNDEFESIKFNRVDQGVEVNCSCNLQKATFCEHVAFILDHFINVVNNPSFLRLIKPNFYQKQLDKALDAYGIQKSNTKTEAIKIVAQNGQLSYSLSKRYQGFTPVVGVLGDKFSNYFKEHIFATNSDEFQRSTIVDTTTLSENIGVVNYLKKQSYS